MFLVPPSTPLKIAAVCLKRSVPYMRSFDAETDMLLAGMCTWATASDSICILTVSEVW